MHEFHIHTFNQPQIKNSREKKRKVGRKEGKKERKKETLPESSQRQNILDALQQLFAWHFIRYGK